MKTKVKVIIELVVEHDKRMPMSEVEKAARNDPHHSRLAGSSVEYGYYRVIEVGRITEC